MISWNQETLPGHFWFIFLDGWDRQPQPGLLHFLPLTIHRFSALTKFIGSYYVFSYYEVTRNLRDIPKY
jgi:hypothetical protein